MERYPDPDVVSEPAREWFLNLFAITVAVLIFGFAWGEGWRGTHAGEGRQESCSTITLSTPDGLPCFPKHHDRSKVP
jgi:hypothetical protein